MTDEDYTEDKKERHSAITFQKSGQYCWETPQEFYDKLNKEFNFTLDPCCTPENAKCSKFFTEKEDGLNQDWQRESIYESTLRNADTQMGEESI